MTAAPSRRQRRALGRQSGKVLAFDPRAALDRRAFRLLQSFRAHVLPATLDFTREVVVLREGAAPEVVARVELEARAGRAPLGVALAHLGMHCLRERQIGVLIVVADCVSVEVVDLTWVTGSEQA